MRISIFVFKHLSTSWIIYIFWSCIVFFSMHYILIAKDMLDLFSKMKTCILFDEIICSCFDIWRITIRLSTWYGSCIMSKYFSHFFLLIWLLFSLSMNKFLILAFQILTTIAMINMVLFVGSIYCVWNDYVK